ncbi:MAG: hypothetical protein AAGF83_20740 [Cyanobacteria bacterium P01_G01_bin.67]
MQIFLELANPDIIFLARPEDALSYIYREVTAHWGKLDCTSLGNAITIQLVNKLLSNIGTSENELIIQNLGLNLDEGLAKSKAKIIANEIEPALANSLFFANTSSIMNDTFAADSTLPEISKSVIKLLIDILSSGTFIQSQYLATFQWQIFSQFVSFFAQDKSEEAFTTFKELRADIFVGRVNRKQGGEYQLPTIEFSTVFVNAFVPSVMTDYAYYIDYCHEVLACDRNYLNGVYFMI